MAAVYPDGATEAALTDIYRPRPGLPFTAMTLVDRVTSAGVTMPRLDAVGYVGKQAGTLRIHAHATPAPISGRCSRGTRSRRISTPNCWRRC